MSFAPLPRAKVKPAVPPIKCQGIKTKLVSFILANICWDGHGRWIEPFLGSGVVAFTVQPERAILNDVNPHIIKLYRRIFDGTVTGGMVKEHLTVEGQKLAAEG